MRLPRTFCPQHGGLSPIREVDAPAHPTSRHIAVDTAVTEHADARHTAAPIATTACVALTLGRHGITARSDSSGPQFVRTDTT